MRAILERLFELGEGKVRTSDVIGLDWSVGALGGSHGFITILSALDPSPEFVSAVTACTWSSYNSVYQIGENLYGQTRYGTVQTGMLCTSQEGGAARAIDGIHRGVVSSRPFAPSWGCVIRGGRSHPQMAPTPPSPLESPQLLECRATRGVAHSEPAQPAG